MHQKNVRDVSASLLTILFVLGSMMPLSGQERPQRESQTSGLRRMPRELTQATIKRHVIAPAHIKNTEMEVEAANEVAFEVAKKPTVQFKGKPTLNVEQFAALLHSVLKNSTAGYVMELRQNGNPIYATGAGWAQTPNDHGLGWTVNTRMHIASASKLLTAVALVKALDSKQPRIDVNEKIADYLPAYWSKGPNVDKITFKHLLTHKSGFAGPSTHSDYAYMKHKVSLGVPPPGGESIYQNMNFGLMRILIPIINGDLSKNFEPAAHVRDQVWDVTTINFYKEYMQDHVFTPAGVANAGFAPLPGPVNSALAYSFPPAGGWNSGDMQTVAGGAGWRLSVKELLDVMNHVRRKNTIISTTRAQDILDSQYGINDKESTPAGTMYWRKGAWGNGGRHEQCVAFFLPNDMEVVVFVNSRVSPSSFSLRKLVGDIYANTLRD